MCSSRAPASRCVVTASSKKIDIKKQGLESIKDDVVKANLQGISRKMDKKGWVDSQGRKGKVLSTVHTCHSPQCVSCTSNLTQHACMCICKFCCASTRLSRRSSSRLPVVESV